jgi:DNA topoisomerase-6 subunit B
MKPHPYGLEWGILYRIIQGTQSRTLAGFLVNEFSSVGAQTAKEICKVARLDPNVNPKELDREQIEKLLGAMQKVKIQRPPTECVVPIGNEDLTKSLKSEYQTAEFITVRSREPEVYRGFPFAIEVGIVYGGDLPSGETVQVQRFANRVPLLYQAGACATMEAAKETDWKRYGMQQSGGSLPSGPMILLIHMCGVWVPFASEAKEAIAPYPEIVKEMKLAIQDAGRELSRYLSGKRRRGEAHRRLLIFERYATEVAEALAKLTGKSKPDIEKKLTGMISEKVSFEDVAEAEGEKGEVKKEVTSEEKKTELRSKKSEKAETEVKESEEE